jgi:archaellum component FlaC
MATESTALARITKLGPAASLVLAVSLVFTSVIGKFTTNSDTTSQNAQKIEALSKQVANLQEQVANQLVIANELKNVKESQQRTQTSVEKLADEVHKWQIEERKFHR